MVKDLILPYFIIAGKNKRERISALPGIYRLSIDNLIKDVKEIKASGINKILLFGVTRKKDSLGSAAYQKDGLIPQAIKAIKKKVKGMMIITDVCLCGYTTHGHCRLLKRENRFVVDTANTLNALAKISLVHAAAGADFVAPSAMMDGQVRAIRQALDRNGFAETKILAYSAKYASNFYGPFREAMHSAPRFGDRSAYQLDFRNSGAALRKIAQDIAEGADMVMVKPGLAYLDIIYRAKEEFRVPLVAYNVSGEYALVKLAVKEKIAAERDLVLEIFTALKRAGADWIITYHAKEVAQWLK